jgi:hypothetical protein
VLCCAAAGTTEKYWDLFSMRYNLGQPLASIFTPEAQEKYNRLSKLLWRLRRAERALNDAWRILKVGLLGCLSHTQLHPACVPFVLSCVGVGQYVLWLCRKG